MGRQADITVCQMKPGGLEVQLMRGRGWGESHEGWLEATPTTLVQGPGQAGRCFSRPSAGPRWSP